MGGATQLGSDCMDEADSQIEEPWVICFAEIVTVGQGAGSVCRNGLGS